MFNILVLIFICRRIIHVAQNSGRRPAIYVIITIILWFGMQFAGVMIGIMLGLEWVSYAVGWLLALFGALISYVIASHSHYRPRENNPPLELPL